MTAESARAQVRRPRDRKAQLATAAADLFRRRGYHSVGVNDIAAAAGITGPGVYRHFQNKQAVLGHVLLTGVDALAARLGEVVARFGDSGLRPLLLTGAEVAIDQRDLTALWRWQGRHLHQADQKEVIRRTGVLMAGWQQGLRGLRPELDDRDALLLCFAALSVFGSVGDHHAAPPRERFAVLLADLAESVVRSPVVPATASPGVPRPHPTPPASRREELLSAATRLFRDHGFHAVSMEDIGAAAGIAGPSIYRHFTGKSDILLAASRRMADRLTLGLTDSLSAADSPRSALHRLARSYVDTVLRSDDLIAVYANEVGNLPERDAKEMRRLQRAYVAEWVRLVGELTPSLTEAESRVVVQAALTVVNDLPRTRGVNDRPGLAEELTALAIGLLDCGGEGTR